ncbi:helix-turn-helix transcriptional regulator [Pedobacter sp. BMA]|uniref:helix-turn-helix domain-containing protein n=1 Tax=Pedobacter sp. BMA TaxID=1663685 RepID=UPI000649E3B9|nr:helix-turn-helix transcriptional regulator [Pedobacter sp. BMA]KLT63642.1 hypothetical protein AB669_20975 [Pedobacter sp. BMA]
MSIIQHINLLKNHIGSKQLDKLEAGALRHKEQSNIEFSITAVDDTTIQVSTVQNETSSGKYASEATLLKRTQDLFRKQMPGYEIVVSAETKLPSPAQLVNVPWIENKMKEKGIRIKQIAFDTGIDRESIADWVTGKRAMSQIVKAMFYFYLIK